jgi:hypothetical protein
MEDLESYPRYMHSDARPVGMTEIRPRWLARLLAAMGRDDGAGDTYEVVLARSGRVVEIVTVQAQSEAVAIERAQRYFAANIYPLRMTRKAGQ